MSHRLSALTFSLLLSSLFLVQAAGVVPGATSTKIAPPNTKAVLLADVNVSSVKATSSAGVMNISFSVLSSHGSASNVSYGIIVRGAKSGTILDSVTAEDTLTLGDGKLMMKSITYNLPKNLPEAGVVYLVVYNERGLSLATANVGSLPKGIPELICSRATEKVSCIVSKKATLEITVHEDMQGKQAGVPIIVNIEKNAPYEQNLAKLVESLRPGLYSIMLRAKDEYGASIGSYVAEYIREGDMSRIINSTPEARIENNKVALKVTVYTMTDVSTSSPYMLSVALSDRCGGVQDVPIHGNVTEVHLMTDCTKGDVTVSLNQGAKSIDSIKGAYSLPEGVTLPAVKGVKGITTPLVIALVILVVILLLVGVYILIKRRMALGPVAAIVFLVALFSSVSHGYAATYAIGGSPEYEACNVGLWGAGHSGCVDPGNVIVSYTTSGTVTVPNSVTLGQVYAVNISHTMTYWAPGATQCTDTGPVTYACGSSNIYTDVYHNLPAVPDVQGDRYNSLPGGSPGAVRRDPPGSVNIGAVSYPSTSGVVNVTATTTGSSEDIQFLQGPDATISVGCVPARKTCYTYEDSFNSISIPIANVKVFFSIKDVLHAVFGMLFS
jgi:hypothetical protein